MPFEQRIRARKDASDDEASSDLEDTSASENENAPEFDSSDEDQASTENDSSDGESSPNSTSPSPTPNDASNLTFGTLARAQSTLETRKRKNPSPSPSSTSKRPRQPTKPLPPPPRPSKHAPTAQSSKRAVTRRREVITDIPKPVARDPRFDPLTGPLDINRVSQNYSFLTTYKTSEIAELKAAIRAPKISATEREKLQRTLKRMESRRKAEEIKEERQAVIREHRKQEREKVRSGKTPYFLKEGEVRSKVLEKRFEGMGKRKVDRVIERRRKKVAGREKKMLPERRGFGEGKAA